MDRELELVRKNIWPESKIMRALLFPDMSGVLDRALSNSAASHHSYSRSRDYKTTRIGRTTTSIGDTPAHKRHDDISFLRYSNEQWPWTGDAWACTYVHASGILPIQLPVSDYLPTGHFRYMPAGGDRHDGIEPPALDACINGEKSRGILNTASLSDRASLQLANSEMNDATRGVDFIATLFLFVVRDEYRHVKRGEVWRQN